MAVYYVTAILLDRCLQWFVYLFTIIRCVWWIIFHFRATFEWVPFCNCWSTVLSDQR